jgi:anti-sigma factor (TIGR02949 family)
MDCKTALSLLEPYLDGELDRGDARELEAHVDGCADCRAALTQLGELRQSLRDRSLQYTAPPELRERIRASGRGAGAAAAPSRFGARRAAPSWMRLAAACVLAFGAGGVSMHLWNSEQNSVSVRTQVSRDLLASHWRALAATSPVDVVSSDRHTVKPWFAGKLAVAPVVQDFAEQGFPLVGGRLDYVGSERVAVLVYRHGQHLIDVFVLPAAESAEAIESVQQQGYAVSAVKLGAQTAAMVSDMDREETSRLVRLLESGSRSR